MGVRNDILDSIVHIQMIKSVLQNRLKIVSKILLFDRHFCMLRAKFDSFQVSKTV